jgi:hypothetical protein
VMSLPRNELRPTAITFATVLPALAAATHRLFYASPARRFLASGNLLIQT